MSYDSLVCSSCAWGGGLARGLYRRALSGLQASIWLGLSLGACASAPKPQPSTLARAKAPALRRDCFAVITAAPSAAEFLLPFTDVRQLSDAIRVDDPRAHAALAEHPCSTGPCSSWGDYYDRDADWFFTRIGVSIVAARNRKISDADDKQLATRTLGNFAIAFLSQPDFSCPGKPPVQPSTSEYRSSAACDNDFCAPCAEDGVRGTLEVLDISKMLVHRVDDLRHLKSFRPSLRPDGGLRLELDQCVVEL